MTHETTIKRIQSLVPSVMELEFGCEVNGLIYDNGDLTQSFTSDAIYITKTKNCYHLLAENTIPVIVKISDFEDRYKILGKPITLSVLCLALENNRTEVILTICSDGMHIGHFDQKGYYTYCYWNLSKDNFNDQSEETKTFIGGLLSN